LDYTLTETSTGLDSTATIVITYIDIPPVAVNDTSLNNYPGDNTTLGLLPNDTL